MDPEQTHRKRIWNPKSKIFMGMGGNRKKNVFFSSKEFLGSSQNVVADRSEIKVRAEMLVELSGAVERWLPVFSETSHEKIYFLYQYCLMYLCSAWRIISDIIGFQ